MLRGNFAANKGNNNRPSPDSAFCYVVILLLTKGSNFTANKDKTGKHRSRSSFISSDFIANKNLNKLKPKG